MKSLKIKKLFWKIVNDIEECSDSRIENTAGVVTERGMQLLSGCTIMYGLDDGVVRIYSKENIPLISFTEESEELLALKELFEILDN